jgi:hypothetical protein
MSAPGHDMLARVPVVPIGSTLHRSVTSDVHPPIQARQSRGGRSQAPTPEDSGNSERTGRQVVFIANGQRPGWPLPRRSAGLATLSRDRERNERGFLTPALREFEVEHPRPAGACRQSPDPARVGESPFPGEVRLCSSMGPCGRLGIEPRRGAALVCEAASIHPPSALCRVGPLAVDEEPPFQPRWLVGVDNL